MPSASHHALLLGLGLAAPGFHSDGCLETEHHISQSQYGSLSSDFGSIRKCGCFQLRKAREERIIAFAFQSLGTTGVGAGGGQVGGIYLFSQKLVCPVEQVLESRRQLLLDGCSVIPSCVNLDSDLSPTDCKTAP